LRIYDRIKREHLFVFLVLLSALIVFNSFDDQFGYTGLTVGVANNYVTGNNFIDTIGKYIKNPFGGVVGRERDPDVDRTGPITSPRLNVNVVPSVIRVGETSNLRVLDGTSPYTWRVVETVNRGCLIEGGTNEGTQKRTVDNSIIVRAIDLGGCSISVVDLGGKTASRVVSINGILPGGDTTVDVDDEDVPESVQDVTKNIDGALCQSNSECISGRCTPFSSAIKLCQPQQEDSAVDAARSFNFLPDLFAQPSDSFIIITWNPATDVEAGNFRDTAGFAVLDNQITGNAGLFDSIANFFRGIFGLETRGAIRGPITYDVWRGTDSGFGVINFEVIGSVSTCSVDGRCRYIDRNVERGSLYYYRVGARFNEQQSTEAVLSNVVSARTPVLGKSANYQRCSVDSECDSGKCRDYVSSRVCLPKSCSEKYSGNLQACAQDSACEVRNDNCLERTVPVRVKNEIGGQCTNNADCTSDYCLPGSPSICAEKPCNQIVIEPVCTQQSSRCEIVRSSTGSFASCRDKTTPQSDLTINPPTGLTRTVSGNNIVLNWNVATVSTTSNSEPPAGFVVLDNQITGNAGLFDSIANFFRGIFGLETRGALTSQNLVYDIWRKEGAGAYGAPIRQGITCPPNLQRCSYTDSTAQAGRTYNYKIGVRANTELYYSDAVKFSNEVSVSVPVGREATYEDLDFNGNGVVEITVSGSAVSGADGVLFTQYVGTTTTSSNWDARYDLTKDGRVDFDDFFKLSELVASRPQLECNTYNAQTCPLDRCEVVRGACAVKSDVGVVEERPITITAQSEAVEVSQAVVLSATSQSVSSFRWNILSSSSSICAIAHHGTEDSGPYVSTTAAIRGKNPGNCQVAVTDSVSTDPRKYVGVYTLNVVAPISVTASPDNTRVGQTSILTVTGGVMPYRAGILTEAAGSCELISPSTSTGNTFEIRALTIGTCRTGIVDNRGRTYDSSVAIQSGGLEICGNNVDDDGDHVIDKLDKDCTGSYVKIVSAVPPTRDVLVDTTADFLCGILVGGESADLNNALQYCVDGKIGDSSCSSKSIISGGRVLFENCNVGSTPRMNQTVTCSVNSLCNAPPTTALGNATLSAKFNVVELDICEDGEKGDGLDITSFKINKNKYKAGDEIEVDVKVKSVFEARDVTVETLLYDIDERDTVTSDEDTQEIGRSDSEEFSFKLTIPASVQEDNKHKVYVKVLEDGKEDEQCKFLSKSISIEEGTSCTDRDNDGSCRPADCDDNNANVYPTAAEICSDNVDNNCNGLIDSNDPDCSSACVSGQTRSCGVNIGKCSAGTEACVSGRWSGTCTGSVSPTTETCNDKEDNDCDGLIDCNDSSCSGNVACGSRSNVDIDLDGLEDEWELQYFGTLSFGAEDDSDGDSYSNIKEFEAGTDPKDPNSHPSSRAWIWAIIFVVVLLIIAGAVYYLYFSKPKSTNLGTYTFKNETRAVKNDKKLIEYVKNSLRKGFTRTQVRNALRAKGWTDEEISDAMGKV